MIEDPFTAMTRESSATILFSAVGFLHFLCTSAVRNSSL